MTTHYRHGDISLIHCEETKGENIVHKGSFVLALGETTNHSHRISVLNPNDMTITKDGETYFITLKTEGQMTHEEHKTLVIPAGTYEMKREREYDHFSHSVRQVLD